MKNRAFGLALVVIGLLCRPAAAQLAAQSTSLAAAVAPFISDQTVAVVHVDLSRLDLKAGYDRVEKQWAIPPEQSVSVKDVLKVVESVRKQLVDGGAKDVFLIACSGDDKTSPPAFVVLPVAEGKDTGAVVDVLKTIPGIEAEPFVQKGAVVLAPPESAVPGAVALVKSIKPLKRPEFAAAFESAGASDIQVLFMPNKELIGNLKDAAPIPPEAVTKIETTVDMMRWVAVSLNLPPKPAFALITNWKDDASAKTALDGVQKLLANEVVQDLKKDPTTAKAIDFLTPKQQGPQLRIVLTEANGGIQAVAEGIRANIGKAMEAADKAGGIPGLK